MKRTTKTELLSQINAIVHEYVGSDGMYGIKGHSAERLTARLVAYRRMIELHREYLRLMSQIPDRLQNGLALGAQNEYTATYRQATELLKETLGIWSQQF